MFGKQRIFFEYLTFDPWYPPTPASSGGELTGVGRVGGRAVEKGGRAAQVGHPAVVGVAVHGAGDRSVAALLRRGTGHVAVRRHTAAAAHETCGESGGGGGTAVRNRDKLTRTRYWTGKMHSGLLIVFSPQWPREEPQKKSPIEPN